MLFLLAWLALAGAQPPAQFAGWAVRAAGGPGCRLWDEGRGHWVCPPGRGRGRVLVDDLGALMAQELPRRRSASFFEAYRTQEEIETQLATYDGALLSLSTIGTTFENRAIRLVKINENASLPVILVLSGVHAREWIAPMTVMYTIDYIMANLASTPSMQQYEYHFVVISNPDGYAYTRQERNWRKNRRDYGGSCQGVDINRNFAYRWSQVGSSSNPCTEVYHGPSAASELETVAIQNHMASIGSRARYFLDVHSYYPCWSSVIGYAAGVYPPNYSSEVIPLMDKAQAAIRAVNGVDFATGTAADILGAASGATDDYAYAVGNFNASFTVELRGPSFVISTSNIVPSGKEFTAGFLAMLDVRVSMPASGTLLICNAVVVVALALISLII